MIYYHLTRDKNYSSCIAMKEDSRGIQSVARWNHTSDIHVTTMIVLGQIYFETFVHNGNIVLIIILFFYSHQCREFITLNYIHVCTALLWRQEMAISVT